MTPKEPPSSGTGPFDEFVIVTKWLGEHPFGMELGEDQNPPMPSETWVATGNFAICRDIDSVEAFIQFVKKDYEGRPKSLFEGWMR